MNELKLAYEEMNIHYDIIENMFTIQDKYSNYRQKATACHKLASYSKISNSLAVSMEKLNLTPLTLDVQSAYTLSREGVWDSVKNFFKAIWKYIKRLFLAIFAQDMEEEKKKITTMKEVVSELSKAMSEVMKDPAGSLGVKVKDFEEVIKVDKELLKLSKVEEIVNSGTATGKTMEVAKFKLKLVRDSFIDVLLAARYKRDFLRAGTDYCMLFRCNMLAIEGASSNLNAALDSLVKNSGNFDANDTRGFIGESLRRLVQKLHFPEAVTKLYNDEISGDNKIPQDRIFGYIVDGKHISTVIADSLINDATTFRYDKSLELKTSSIGDIKEDFSFPYIKEDLLRSASLMHSNVNIIKSNIKELTSEYTNTIKNVESEMKKIEENMKKVESRIESEFGKSGSPDEMTKHGLKTVKNIMKQLSTVLVPWFRDIRRYTILNAELEVNHLKDALHICGLTKEQMGKDWEKAGLDLVEDHDDDDKNKKE